MTENLLTNDDISGILLLNARNTEAMKGKVRAKNNSCPVCLNKFEHIAGTIIRCPIHKTVPERFFIDIFDDGKRLKLYTDRHGQVLDTYARALHLLTHINAEIKDHTFDPTQYIKAELTKYFVSILLSEFLEDKLKKIAPSYQRHYTKYVDIAKKHFGNKDVRDLRKRNIIEYHDYIVNNHTFGNKTLKNCLDVFKTFMRYIQDMEIITNIPPFPIIHYITPTITCITPDTQKLLYNNISDHNKPVFAFMFLTGQRPSEARALKCKDIDLETETLTVTSTFSKGIYRDTRKGRGAKPVTIPIHPEILSYIKDRVENNLPEAFVYINNKGEYYKESSLRTLWYKAKDKTGIEKSVALKDATRHSFVTNLLDNGVSIYNASKLAGHSNVKTTERYAHNDVKKRKVDVEGLSLVLKEKVVKLRKVSKL